MLLCQGPSSRVEDRSVPNSCGSGDIFVLDRGGGGGTDMSMCIHARARDGGATCTRHVFRVLITHSHYANGVQRVAIAFFVFLVRTPAFGLSRALAVRRRRGARPRRHKTWAPPARAPAHRRARGESSTEARAARGNRHGAATAHLAGGATSERAAPPARPRPGGACGDFGHAVVDVVGNL